MSFYASSTIPYNQISNMMAIARRIIDNYTYNIQIEIVTCHTQLSKLEIMLIGVVKCVQGQVQHTLSEVQVIVNT